MDAEPQISQPDRPDQGRAGHAGAPGRPRRHGGEHRPHRRDLPRTRRRLAAARRRRRRSPEIVQQQIAAGAIGVTCAKLGEAEVMAAAGIRDILIANQIVGTAEGRAGWSSSCARRSDRGGRQRRERRRARRGGCRPRARAAGGDRGRHRHESRRRRARAQPVVALARRDRAGGRSALRRRDGLGEPHRPDRRPGRKGAHGAATRSALLTASAEACRRPATARDRELRRHGHVSLLRAQPGVTEVQVGGAIFSDVHYRDALPRRLPAGAHHADHGDEPADADPHHSRRRQEGDER